MGRHSRESPEFMRFRFQFRRYRLPFRAVVRTAHGPWAEREGVVVRLDAEEGRPAGDRGPRVGWGEAAPIPWFGTETVDEVLEGCRSLGEWIDAEPDQVLARVPVRLGCLRSALAAGLGSGEGRPGSGEGQGRESGEGQARVAQAGGEGVTLEGGKERGGEPGSGMAGTDIGGKNRSPSSGSARSGARDAAHAAAMGGHSPPPAALPAAPIAPPSALGVAALLPAGRAALGHIAPKADAGFRVFKWKVGVGDLADELALLDDVCASLPAGAKLRLDANGAWDRRKAEKWLERCADRPVEFVEQPCFVAHAEGADRQRRAEDVLRGLADDYPTPIGLDESLVGDGDVERWIGAGWPGVFVVKPSLIGDIRGAMARLEKARARVVFSSALETTVGAQAALRVAFAWTGEPRALGFGVWPLFADRRFDGPVAAPFVRREDVDKLDAEAAWNALS